jgi:hypothetical protein
MQKVQAITVAQTAEQVFAAELDLFRVLASRLPQEQRDRVLNDAAAEVKRRRTATFGDLHKLTSPGTSPGRMRNPRSAQARLRARGPA